jgi:hypothetical protein
MTDQSCPVCGATFRETPEAHALRTFHLDRLEIARRQAILEDSLRAERDPAILTESELRLMDGNR